jgi:hypothetical protein
MQVKQEPRLEPCLYKEEFKEGGQLRFKMLNLEKGRRSRKFEDRLCECFDRPVVASVSHFLFDCSAHMEKTW